MIKGIAKGASRGPRASGRASQAATSQATSALLMKELKEVDEEELVSDLSQHWNAGVSGDGGVGGNQGHDFSLFGFHPISTKLVFPALTGRDQAIYRAWKSKVKSKAEEYGILLILEDEETVSLQLAEEDC
jgi:hypothetical protein